ncbi:MAG: oxidoreductase [Ancylobacter novellus]|uniref:Oxidoreductase n=1 Tax=Ancylobacter novellus TaxID=921 RepID=A0A2W5LST1_ANCNO|nr:MAG: oxidoreductase [Ancylobacter novellus]
MNTAEDLRLRVESLRREAEGVISIELDDVEGRDLPGWEPGANLQIRLPSGLIRQYSLYDSGRGGRGYRIAVKDVEGGRGGSKEVHRGLRVGDIVQAKAPTNAFRLSEAEDYLFLAGGIGITPILPMVRSMNGSDSWRLVYFGKSRHSMGLLREVEELPAENVLLAPKDVAGRVDLQRLVSEAKPGTRIFACGPAPVLDELERSVAARDDVFLHLERFSAPASAKPQSSAEDQAFEVELQKSGKVLNIPPGSSILDEVLKVNPDAAYSCAEGFCGTCEVRVLAGEVDHRDSLLTEEEQKQNKTMMICVSRAAGSKLVLDL